MSNVQQARNDADISAICVGSVLQKRARLRLLGQFTSTLVNEVVEEALNVAAATPDQPLTGIRRVFEYVEDLPGDWPGRHPVRPQHEPKTRRQRRGDHLDLEDDVTALATARFGDSQTTPMDLLAQGVPLSLLLDLFAGPRSEEILREEALRIAIQRGPTP